MTLSQCQREWRWPPGEGDHLGVPAHLLHSVNHGRLIRCRRWRRVGGAAHDQDGTHLVDLQASEFAQRRGIEQIASQDPLAQGDEFRGRQFGEGKRLDLEHRNVVLKGMMDEATLGPHERNAIQEVHVHSYERRMSLDAGVVHSKMGHRVAS